MMSWRHLNRYVNGFTGRHNQRELDTLDRMAQVVLGMNGKRIESPLRKSQSHGRTIREAP